MKNIIKLQIYNFYPSNLFPFLFKVWILGLASFTLCGLCFEDWAHSEIRPERVHIADAKKSRAYVKDGLIIGGDRNVDGVIIQDIRRATNADFDRIVIDLQGTTGGEATEIQRPPYYQIAVSPDERRLIFTIWGKPKLNFNAKKVVGSFKKSSVIQELQLFPKLEDELWTFVLEQKSEAPIEVFELSNPVRIIVDIQHQKG